MIKSGSKKKFILTLICCLALCAQAILSVLCFSSNISQVSAASSQLISSGDFNDSPTVKSLQSPNSWTKVTTYDDLTYAGVINVLKSDSQNYFNDYCESSYGLTTSDYPDKFSSAADNKILMINGQTKSSRCGYKSASVALSANSYYVFSVYAKTLPGASASIYLSGISDVTLDSTNSFVMTNSNVWKQYNIFVKTGLEAKTCNLELWLGTNGNAGSQSAVFFDSANGKQLSGKDYYSTLNSVSEHKEIDLSTSTFSVPNGNFDNGVHSLEKIFGSTGELVSVSADYACNDLSYENVGAYKFSNPTANATSYKSQNIKISRHGYYIISVNAKLIDVDDSGKFTISLKETDDLKEKFLDYTAHTSSLSLSTVNTTLDTTNNGFATYSFYVKGNTLYDTNVFLQFDLGTTETMVKGTASIDNITFRGISYSQYSSGTTGTTLAKLDITSQTSTPLIVNGHFNEVQPKNQTTLVPVYPMSPANWTQSIEDGMADSAYSYGVMADTTNNYLIIENKISSWQQVISDSFTLSASTTYEITFQAKTNITSGKLSATLNDSTNGIIATFKEIVSNGDYMTYKVVVRTSTDAVTATIAFNLGNENEKSIGSAYIDIVRATTKSTMTDSVISDIINNANLNERVVDYTALWSILSEEVNSNGIYDIATFEVTKDSNNNFAGAIKSGDNNYDINSSKTGNFNNLLLIDNIQNGTTTLKAKSPMTLTSGKYYLISIDLKTLNITTTKDEKYGVSISLDGIEKKFENVISVDDFKTYKFYIYASEDVKPTLTLTLASTTNQNSHGVAIFDNFSSTEITQVKFDEDTASIESETMSNVLKIGETPAITEDETTEDNTEDDKNSIGNSDLWLLIPTIIFGLTTIFAVVAFSLRKIKIKKWELKKKSTYDRSKTLEKDIARREAEEKKKLELALLQEELDKIEAEIQEYEKQYQSELQAYRTAKAQYKAEKKVEKSERIERKFKEYASKRAKLEDKTQDIKDKMDSFNNPEYLIMEERKIQIKNEKAKRKQETESAKKAKQQAKIAKQQAKAEKKKKR